VGRDEEEGAQIFTDIFRGGLGGEPPLKIPFVGVAHPISRLRKWAPFWGADGGMNRPYKVFLGAAQPPAAPENGAHLQYRRSICKNGWYFGPPLKKFEVLLQIIFCSSVYSYVLTIYRDIVQVVAGEVTWT